MTLGSESSVERTWLYMRHTLVEGGYVGLPLAAVGVIYVYVQSRNALRRKPVSVVGGSSGGSTQQTKSSKRNARAVPARDHRAPGDKDTSYIEPSPLANQFDAASLSGPSWEVLCLVTCWVFYTAVWHFVFSNIPLSSPMPYGVHARYSPPFIVTKQLSSACGVMTGSGCSRTSLCMFYQVSLDAWHTFLSLL
jgi:hypothetical protein